MDDSQELASERVCETADLLEIIFAHCGLLRLETQLKRVNRLWRTLARQMPARWAAAGTAGILGVFGDGAGGLDEPECAVRLANGGLAVTDTLNHRIQTICTPRLDFSRCIGRRGPARGEFNGPMGLATDGHSLFCVDCDNSRVQQLSVEGACLDCIGEHGRGAGQLHRPSGLALTRGDLSSGSRLYVADTYNHRICVFGVSPLRYLFCFGKEGEAPLEFRFPIGLAVDAGRLYVADRGNARVQVLTLDGRFLFFFGGLRAAETHQRAVTAAEEVSSINQAAPSPASVVQAPAAASQTTDNTPPNHNAHATAGSSKAAARGGGRCSDGGRGSTRSEGSARGLSDAMRDMCVICIYICCVYIYVCVCVSRQQPTSSTVFYMDERTCLLTMLDTVYVLV